MEEIFVDIRGTLEKETVHKSIDALTFFVCQDFQHLKFTTFYNDPLHSVGILVYDEEKKIISIRDTLKLISWFLQHCNTIEIKNIPWKEFVKNIPSCDNPNHFFEKIANQIVENVKSKTIND